MWASRAANGARLTTFAVLLALVAGCAGGPAATIPGGCAAVPKPDVRTVSGWVGYLAAHREDIALVVDDGYRTRIEHRADAVQAMASASKVLNLVGYARAVALGRVAPDDPVRVGDWERWMVAGDGESHIAALDHLGIARNGDRARDPNRRITLEQLANQMIIWSDNAAPDYLRALLGDRMLRDAARSVGWRDPELPSTTGFIASFYTPELVGADDDRATRRGVEWTLARRYAYDREFRAELDTRPEPPGFDETRFVDGGPGGTARQLAALWSAVGHGGFPGAERARRIAEQGPSRIPGVTARGVKGGSLSGILARGTELRRTDGTVGVAVLLVRRFPAADLRRITADDSGFNGFLSAAVLDPAVTRALRCRFGSR